MRKINFILVCWLFFASCEQTKFEQGRRIYETKCSNCHMKDGNGLNGLIPSLLNRVDKLSNVELRCTILNGKTSIKKEDNLMLNMPAITDLSDAEMCNLLNYVNEKWRSDKKILTLKDVNQMNCGQ